MILLQAGIGLGFLLILLFVVLLIIGIPFLVKHLMETYWKLSGKIDNIKNKLPYHKDTLPFVVCVYLSLLIIFGLFYSLLLLFDKLFPHFLL